MHLQWEPGPSDEDPMGQPRLAIEAPSVAPGRGAGELYAPLRAEGSPGRPKKGNAEEQS